MGRSPRLRSIGSELTPSFPVLGVIVCEARALGRGLPNIRASSLSMEPRSLVY